jgi:four helix bundle protein
MNNKANPIREKTYAFSIKIIRAYKQLHADKEFVLSKQLLRSGTSIGANVEEAVAGQSRRDFIAKMQISLKEANETHYWIRLLRDSELLASDVATGLLLDCEEIRRLLTSILKTSKLNQRAAVN